MELSEFMDNVCSHVLTIENSALETTPKSLGLKTINISVWSLGLYLIIQFCTNNFKKLIELSCSIFSSIITLTFWVDIGPAQVGLEVPNGSSD